MDPGKKGRIKVVMSNSVPISNWYQFGIKASVHDDLRWYFLRLTVGQ